jgi:hypothetical protein
MDTNDKGPHIHHRPWFAESLKRLLINCTSNPDNSFLCVISITDGLVRMPPWRMTAHRAGACWQGSSFHRLTQNVTQHIENDENNYQPQQDASRDCQHANSVVAHFAEGHHGQGKCTNIAPARQRRFGNSGYRGWGFAPSLGAENVQKALARSRKSDTIGIGHQAQFLCLTKRAPLLLVEPFLLRRWQWRVMFLGPLFSCSNDAQQPQSMCENARTCHTSKLHGVCIGIKTGK